MSIEVMIIVALAVALVVIVWLLVNSRDREKFMQVTNDVASQRIQDQHKEMENLRLSVETAGALKVFDGITKRGDKIHITGFQNYINRAGDMQLALLPTGDIRTDYLSGLIGVEEAYNRYVNGLGVLDKTYIGTNNGTKIVLSPSRVY